MQDGLIQQWYDRKILAGGNLDLEISERLETFDLFLMLVSPDFLASDYCTQTEMGRILERNDAAEAIAVPIIVEPCDWKSTQLRHLKALPEDGKPVSVWPNPNSAYLDVAQELRRMLEASTEVSIVRSQESIPKGIPEQSRNSTYRVRQDFTSVERSKFRESAFLVIREYFRKSVKEIEQIDELQGQFVEMSIDSFSCTVINVALQSQTTHISVHMQTDRIRLGDITYVYMARAAPDSANGVISIHSDGFKLSLKANIDFTDQEKILSAEETAELLWEKFLEKAEVTRC